MDHSTTDATHSQKKVQPHYAYVYNRGQSVTIGVKKKKNNFFLISNFHYLIVFWLEENESHTHTIYTYTPIII